MGPAAMAMDGKEVLITGGTSGIGQATAVALAARGASVAVVGRRPAKGRRALEALRNASGADTHTYLQADLSLMEGVRSLAQSVRQRFDRLHILMNNAGGYYLRRHVTSEGLEKTFALNHLAPFLLTHLLLDLLRASDDPRIITTASGSHRGSKIRFDDLQLERRYRSWVAYGQSKLANILFTKELARRLEPEGIPANCFHPGFVNTEIAQDNPLVRPFAALLLSLLGKSPREGARTAVYLAVDPQASQLTGAYFVDEQPVAADLPENEPEVSHRLWEVSERLTSLEVEHRLERPS